MVSVDLLDAAPDAATPVLARRLRAIALIRGAVVAVVAVYLATAGRALVTAQDAPLAVATVALALGFSLAVPLLPGRAERAVLDLSIVVDAGTVGVLLALTGGTASPFTPLVVVVAVLALMAFGARTGLRAAVAVSVAMGWVWASSPDVIATEAGSAVPREALVADTRVVVVLLATWAAVGAVAMLTRVVEGDLRRSAASSDSVHQIGRSLEPEEGADGVADQLATAVVERLDLAEATVWLSDRTHPGLLLTAAASRSGQHATASDLEVARAGLVARALSSPSAVEGTPEGTLADVHPRGPLVAVRLQGDATAPHGVLVVRPGGRAASADPHLLRALQDLGDDAGNAIDAAHALAHLRAQARTDPVTGMPNHRVLQERLRSDLSRLDRLRGRGRRVSLSLALLDLDHFKRVNDTHGHPTGDAVLAAVADALGRTARTGDVVCRYGGEEFAVVLPETDGEQAVAACERFRRAVASVRVTAPDGTSVAVTASFGIATVTEPGVERGQLVEAADQALYRAKDAGRNTVVSAGPVQPAQVRSA